MIHVWFLTPKGAPPIALALCREHGRALRAKEAEFNADGWSLTVVRNSLAIVKIRREAGGSRHLRACVECGRDSGTVATFIRGPLDFTSDELATEGAA